VSPPVGRPCRQRSVVALRRLDAIVLCLALAMAPGQPARADEGDEDSLHGDAELAQELSNPLADLMTIPIQMNYDDDIGPRDDGWRLQTNIQPVVPIRATTGT
jgi:hypothetical protein